MNYSLETDVGIILGFGAPTFARLQALCRDTRLERISTRSSLDLTAYRHITETRGKSEFSMADVIKKLTV
jgi:hypothetical protein